MLFQYPNFTDLLDKIGVKVESIKSSPLKAAPDGFEPTRPEARAAIEFDHQGIPMPGSKAWCRIAGISTTASLQAVADGRVFTGHQGIGLKLIDELGDERTGIAWLAKEKKSTPSCRCATIELHNRVSATCRSCTRRPRRRSMRRGLTTLARQLDDWGAVQAVERLNLDGLLALWHPAGAN